MARRPPGSTVASVPRTRLLAVAGIGAVGGLAVLAWAATATGTPAAWSARPPAGPVAPAQAPGAGGTATTGAPVSTPVSDCLAGVSGPQVNTGPVRLCVQTAVENAAATMTAAQANRMLASADRIDPRAPRVCHPVAHDVFRDHYLQAARTSPAQAEAELAELLASPDRGCGDGVINGMLAGWVQTGPERADFQRLQRVCLRDTDPAAATGQGGRQEGCAHSFGIAVWERWRSPGACADLTRSDLVHACAVGAVMRMYQPVSVSSRARVPKEDVVALCTTGWPAGVPVDACYDGAMYAFRGDFAAALLTAAGKVGPGGAIPESAAGDLLAGWDASLAWCRRLAGDTGHRCFDGMWKLSAMALVPAGIRAQLCARLDDPWPARCQDALARLPDPGERTGGQPAQDGVDPAATAA